MVDPIFKEEDYNFKENYILFEKNKMHYVDEGEGDPILMLHGNPTWSFYYRHLANRFKKNRRVVIPDHIGCGLSDKPQNFDYRLENHIQNIEALVKRLELKEITLIVHDWGGAIGFGFATRHPDLIKKIVILNTAAYTCDYIPPQINICKTPFFGEKVIRHFNAFAKAATTMAVTQKMSPRLKKAYIAPYNNYQNRIATSRFVEDIPMSEKHPSYQTLLGIEKKLSTLTCPKLVLWGKKDFCFNDYFLNRWKEIYPDAKYIEYENAGHYILEDAKNEVELEIENFL